MSGSEIIHGAKVLIEKYKTRKISYETARNGLGDLLNKSVTDKIYHAFEELVKMGAPITYNNGTPFARGIGQQLYAGTQILKELSSERITYYMKDETRAHSLLVATSITSLRIVIDKDKNKNKSIGTAYIKMLADKNSSKVMLLLENIDFPLSSLEQALDEIIYSGILNSGNVNNIILKKIIKEDLNYLTGKVDDLIANETDLKYLLNLMTEIYYIDENLYVEYVEHLPENILEYFIRERRYRKFDDKLVPIIKAYIELDEHAAIKAVKESMIMWDNILTFLDYMKEMDEKVAKDLLEYTFTKRDFNERIVEYYLELNQHPGMALDSRNLGIDIDKVLYVVTKASVAGNTDLIDSIRNFFIQSEDHEMIRMIEDAAIIGG